MTWHQAIIPPPILNPEIPFLSVPDANPLFACMWNYLKPQFVLIKTNKKGTENC